MTLIFICSYLNVSCVVDCIEHEGGDFRILSADKDLADLFLELYGDEQVIKLPSLFDSFGNIKSFLNDLYRLSKNKRKFLKILSEINPSKVIFYYTGWNGFESWLIKKLSSNSQIFYRPKVNIRFKESNYSIKNLVKTFILSLIYGIKFESSIWYGHPIISIGDSFLNQVGALNYDHKYNPKNVNKLVKEKYNEYRNIKVLLLVGGEYYLDSNIYDKKMHAIYDILLKYYQPGEVGFKSHPNFPKINFDWSGDSVILPDKVPASLLCFIVEVVIGYGSGTLYEAADMGLISVSVIDMVPSALDGHAQRTKNHLLNNTKSNKIHFPKNLNEFNNIL